MNDGWTQLAYANVSIPQSGFLVVKPCASRRAIRHSRVSIPQSGFLVVKQLGCLVRASDKLEVSIPQSGFLVVKRRSRRGRKSSPGSFNPSVGILGGQTRAVYLEHDVRQSFNPSVGILGGQTRVRSGSGVTAYEFQSLSRDSWWSNFNEKETRGANIGFNPSVGILGGQTRDDAL